MNRYENMTRQELKGSFKRLYQARRGEYNPHRPVLQSEWQSLLDVLNQRLTLSEKEQFVDEMKDDENVEAKICTQCENIMTYLLDIIISFQNNRVFNKSNRTPCL